MLDSRRDRNVPFDYRYEQPRRRVYGKKRNQKIKDQNNFFLYCEECVKLKYKRERIGETVCNSKIFVRFIFNSFVTGNSNDD